MKARVVSILFNGLCTLVIVVSGRATTALSPSGVLITEMQTAGTTDAGAEFVRIANQSSGLVSIDTWKLQYKSANGTTWTTKVTLAGSLGPGEVIMVATPAFITNEPHQTMADGLAQAGGHIKLIDVDGVAQDLVGWGTAIAAEGAAAPAPDKDQSLLRSRVGDAYVDSDHNLQDFILEAMPLPPPKPAPAPTPAPTSSPTTNAAVLSASTNQGLAAPQITELLPNPASPQTDANDEFIELYNPNRSAFALKGYKLQTGKTYSNNISLSAESIPAGGYLVVTSAESSLSLSNAAGAVRLVDPSGAVIAESEPYDKADAGMTWIMLGDSWQWSAQPTPGSANVKTDATSAVSANDNETGSSKSAKSKSLNQSADKHTETADDTTAKSPRIHTVVIALVGCLAVAYAIYEYRHDIGNLIYKLRSYRERRRSYR